MRIIAGNLKGRRIITFQDLSYRPLTSALKESIFSILSSGQFINLDTNQSILKDATIIDAFGGTGSFAFEAISRGASKAFVIEKETEHINALKKNIDKLGISSKVRAMRGDSLNLRKASTKYSIAFLDPPFKKGLVRDCVKCLISKEWLDNNALIIIRTHKEDEYDINSLCTKVFSRKYSNSFLRIYKFCSIKDE